MNVLNKIMGVQEASEIWGLSPDHIKRLCRDGKVMARNIGNTWIMIKNQPNPKGGRKMKVYYEEILVGEIVTNQIMTVDEALELLDFNEQEFIEQQGFDDIDYNDFKLVY